MLMKVRAESEITFRSQALIRYDSRSILYQGRQWLGQEVPLQGIEPVSVL